MNQMEHDYISRQEGREEGRQEGRQECMEEVIGVLIENTGMTREEVIKLLNKGNKKPKVYIHGIDLNES